jgi:serine protease Do
MSLRQLGSALLFCLACAAVAQTPGGMANSHSTSNTPKVSVSGIGTGFVVADGYLLTALHVVRDPGSVWVGPFEGKRWSKAEVVASDTALDLALLRAKFSAPVLSLAAWAEVPVGLEVSVIGYPQPRLQGLSKKITQGIVNGNRSDRNESFDAGFFQLSAEISKGNSGSPVLSPEGWVVGMVQKKLDALSVASKVNDLPVNVNYALKSSELIAFLQKAGLTPQIKALNPDFYQRPYKVFAQTQGSIWTVAVLKGLTTTESLPLPTTPP